MVFVFSPIFYGRYTKIVFVYNFAAPLKEHWCKFKIGKLTYSKCTALPSELRQGGEVHP